MLNHKRTKSFFAPPIFYVAKKLQLKDRRFPKKATKMIQTDHYSADKVGWLFHEFCNNCVYETKQEKFGSPPKGIS
jgi:hypothetical protein